jgi:hypothetical protein
MWEAAVRAEPTMGQAHHKWGQALGRSCQLQEAERALNQALALQPGALHVYLDLAAVWWSSDGKGLRTEQSRSAAAEAIRHLRSLASNLQEAGRPNDAAAVAAKVSLIERGDGFPRLLCQ